MDPTISAASTRVAARRGRRALTACLAMLASLALAGVAMASDPIPRDLTPGFTAPAGLVRDTHGDLWVSDSHGGICRLIEPESAHAPATPGVSPLVIDQYCNPDPLAVRVGPVAPGQLAFDPVNRMFLVGDGASGSGSVWRLHLNESVNPAVIDSAERIIDFSGILVLDRVFGMSYDQGADALDFTTKNSPNIQRVAQPATCLAPCLPFNLGSAEGNAVGSVIHDSAGTLYLADVSGVTSLTPGNIDTQARPVPGLAGAYSALAYDPDHEGGLLYAGTTNLQGVDWIDRMQVSTGLISTYSSGFDGVTAIGLRSNGDLDVAQDPCVKQVCEDAGATGQLYRVQFEAFLPPPVIVDGPPTVSNATSATFYFTHATTPQFFCSLDAGPKTLCGAAPQSLQSYVGLADGSHVFEVQADNTVTGPRARRRFTVDTRAPIVTIGGVQITGALAEVQFSSNEMNVNYTCRLDTNAPAPCDPPARFDGLANGVHSVTVGGADFVGNQATPVATFFRIGPPPVRWRPGRVIATLRGRTLRVVFNAPPGARFARFTMTKKRVYPVRTKFVRVRGGKRNVIQIVLPRAAAQRLQKKYFILRADAGAKTSKLTYSGRAYVKITRRLR